jgi:Tat protein translocase TatB subunit
MRGPFGVGPLELLVIGVLALIGIGPERLPGVIRQVMPVVGELRGWAAEVQRELRDEFARIQEELQGRTQDVSSFAQDLAQETTACATEAQPATDLRPALIDLRAPSPHAAPPARPARAGMHAVGVSRDAAEGTPACADYRPRSPFAERRTTARHHPLHPTGHPSR